VTATKTLLELAGADLAPPKLRDACLILIDLQNEYLDGPVAVPDAAAAIANAAHLLQHARDSGTPIFHIAHRGKASGLFDRAASRGQIAEAVAPLPGESILEKTLPNAFAGTALEAQLKATQRANIILAGLMTHMCVSSTARAALDLGFRTAVAADCCATRALPDGHGGTIDAGTVHKVALAELSDRFAIVVHDHRALP
jgi:nicotinamidase-related amidase